MTARISDQWTRYSNSASEPTTTDFDSWISIAELVGDSEQVDGMLVASEPSRKVMTSIARIAPYKTAVLVHGESGVGKELISRAIHRQGPTPNGPFVTFNCSNLVAS